MASTAEHKKPFCCKFGLKPFTTNNILYYYLPAQGVLSYTALSVNVMNPSLVMRLFPKRDVTNVLLLHTIVGTGLYLYDRPHLKTANKQERILYSIFGATTFSLGSLLSWAILRSLVPDNIPLCTLCGIGSGLALLKLGRSYVEHLDNNVKP